MALMQWDDNMSVKVVRIDTEHQKLIDLINELHDAMQIGKGSDILGNTLNKLLNYASLHFSAEELFLGQHGYPELAQHKIIHKKLVDQVFDFQKKYAEGEVFPPATLTFLKDWLTTHIMVEDKKYAAYLKSIGVIG